MKTSHILLAACLLTPCVLAEGLPDLGDVSQASLSPLQERKLGEEIMREIRADRAYLDDAELADYLNGLGNRLAASSTDSKQAYEFFAIDDPSVNAFALPGGFIGVHTGLLLTAQSESELASVLSHEIAHVTQRHIARIIAGQQRSQLASLAAMAAAVLLARSNAQASQAVMVGSQAAVIQSQLDFTREHEREADRVGVQILEKAGFDVRAMPVFFERMQRATRFVDGKVPSYLRTHPLTYERIADVQNRTQTLPYRQVADSLDFQMLRARVRAAQGTVRDAVSFFNDSLEEKKFSNEAATRFGLAHALVRADKLSLARMELERLRVMLPSHPAIEMLAARLMRLAGDSKALLEHYRISLGRFPNYRALAYEYADALIDNRMPELAMRVIEEQQLFRGQDVRLFQLQAKGYAALGKRLSQHRAQAEAYARLGQVGAAIDQLQIGLRAGDADFYQLSSAEARLRELKAQEQENRRRP